MCFFNIRGQHFMYSPHSEFSRQLKAEANFNSNGFEMTRTQRVGSCHNRSQLIITASEGFHQLNVMASFMPSQMRHSSNIRQSSLSQKLSGSLGCVRTTTVTLTFCLCPVFSVPWKHSRLLSVFVPQICEAVYLKRCFLFD